MRLAATLMLSALPLLAAAPVLAQGAPPACPAQHVQVNNTNALLTNNYLCAARLPDIWQEYHQAGGQLHDWKRGPGHAVDPTKLMGTWVGSNSSGLVTHTYGGGALSYTWRICRVLAGGGSFSYTLLSATAGTISGATVVAGTLTQTTRPCPAIEPAATARRP